MLEGRKRMQRSHYQSPLVARYASPAMLALFSDDRKFLTWRRLWIALAEAQQELGLPITDAQIKAMKEAKEPIDYDLAESFEKKLRHDVMAHVHAYAKACPEAAGIIHLGATSCFVTDNTDLLLMHEGLRMIQDRLVDSCKRLRDLSLHYKDLPILSYTHFQAAQPSTLGKRMALWLQDLLMDYQALEQLLKSWALRSCKGTTGTQASFLALFDGDAQKVLDLDRRLAQKMGFEERFPITAQTYPRKLDYQVLSVLSGIAQSAHKFSNDLRLLQHMKAVEEPFEENQIGSSAMAYKRNPMRSERMCSLARFVMSLPINASMTAAEQWFERTLDDSANKRIVVPEAFLATDAILSLYQNITEGLVVHEAVLKRQLMDVLPMMASENILMAAVKAGGDRQVLHEKIRQASLRCSEEMHTEGKPNHFLRYLAEDPAFGMDEGQMQAIMERSHLEGLASLQTEMYILEDVDPILEAHQRGGSSGDHNIEI